MSFPKRLALLLVAKGRIIVIQRVLAGAEEAAWSRSDLVAKGCPRDNVKNKSCFYGTSWCHAGTYGEKPGI